MFSHHITGHIDDSVFTITLGTAGISKTLYIHLYEDD